MEVLFTQKDFKKVDTYYVLEAEDFDVEIDEEDFNDEEIAFSNKLISLYNENLMNIAKACVKSETFKICYPEETTETIIEKLGKPIFRRMGNTTLLTYTEHTIDYDHILDIEFSGLYQDFIYIGIDG